MDHYYHLMDMMSIVLIHYYYLMDMVSVVLAQLAAMLLQCLQYAHN